VTDCEVHVRQPVPGPPLTRDSLESAKWAVCRETSHGTRHPTIERETRGVVRICGVQIFLRDWLTRRYKSKSLPEQFPTSLYLCCWGAESLSTTHIHAHFRAQCLFITSYKSKKCHHQGLGRCSTHAVLQLGSQKISKVVNMLIFSFYLEVTFPQPTCLHRRTSISRYDGGWRKSSKIKSSRCFECNWIGEFWEVSSQDRNPKIWPKIGDTEIRQSEICYTIRVGSRLWDVQTKGPSVMYY
jgi:hypothetical protein